MFGDKLHLQTLLSLKAIPESTKSVSIPMVKLYFYYFDHFQFVLINDTVGLLLVQEVRTYVLAIFLDIFSFF